MPHFYTEHPAYGGWACIAEDPDMPGFNNPEAPRITRWLVSIAEEDRVMFGEVRPPSYMAHTLGLASAAAAIHCANVAIDDHDFSFPWDDEDDEPCPGECCYVGPDNPTLDGEHSHWCECDDCCPCDCGDLDCSSCGDSGNIEYDDQDAVDDWDGRPDMPPAARGRCRFGIEIEFNQGNRRAMMPVLQRQGFAVVDLGYTHEITRCWKMTTDSTVSGGELVSPIMSGDDESIETVREAIRIVKQNGGTTGRNVGLHVHLDATEFRRSQLRAMAANMRAFEKLLSSFVPDHRLRGDGSLIQAHSWDEIEEWITRINLSERARTSGNRSRACPVHRAHSFNFNSLLTYGTVECRLLGHTLNTIKVRTWIRTLQTIMSVSRRRLVVPAGVDGLDWLVQYGLEQEHADHFRVVAAQRGKAAMLTIAA